MSVKKQQLLGTLIPIGVLYSSYLCVFCGTDKALWLFSVIHLIAAFSYNLIFSCLTYKRNMKAAFRCSYIVISFVYILGLVNFVLSVFDFNESVTFLLMICGGLVSYIDFVAPIRLIKEQSDETVFLVVSTTTIIMISIPYFIERFSKNEFIEENV